MTTNIIKIFGKYLGKHIFDVKYFIRHMLGITNYIYIIQMRWKSNLKMHLTIN